MICHCILLYHLQNQCVAVRHPGSLQASQALVRLPLEVIGLDGQISAKDQDQQQPRHSTCIPKWVSEGQHPTGPFEKEVKGENEFNSK